MDEKIIIQELKLKVKEFCDRRDWDQFHNAKELATALIIESAELLEHFRWKTSKEVNELFENPIKKEEISDEVADIFYFLLRLSQMYDLDLSEALNKKMEKNEKKYPLEKAKGSNKKYNELI